MMCYADKNKKWHIIKKISRKYFNSSFLNYNDVTFITMNDRTMRTFYRIKKNIDNSCIYDKLVQYIGACGVIQYTMVQKDAIPNPDDIKTIWTLFNDIESLFYWWDLAYLINYGINSILLHDDPLYTIYLVNAFIDTGNVSNIKSNLEFNCRENKFDENAQSIESFFFKYSDEFKNVKEVFIDNLNDETDENETLSSIRDLRYSLIESIIDNKPFYIYNDRLYDYPPMVYDYILLPVNTVKCFSAKYILLTQSEFQRIKKVFKIEVYVESEPDEHKKANIRELISVYSYEEMFELINYLRLVQFEYLNYPDDSDYSKNFLVYVYTHYDDYGASDFISFFKINVNSYDDFLEKFLQNI